MPSQPPQRFQRREPQACAAYVPQTCTITSYSRIWVCLKIDGKSRKKAWFCQPTHIWSKADILALSQQLGEAGLLSSKASSASLEELQCNDTCDKQNRPAILKQQDYAFAGYLQEISKKAGKASDARLHRRLSTHQRTKLSNIGSRLHKYPKVSEFANQSVPNQLVLSKMGHHHDVLHENDHKLGSPFWTSQILFGES